MRRHLEDHPNLNSNRVYGHSSLSFNSINSTNSPARAVINADARVGNTALAAPVTTAPTSTTSSGSSLVLHHTNRTVNNSSSPSTASGTSSGGAAANSKPSIQRQPLALIQETVHSVGPIGGGDMQTGVQFSLPSGYQSRVAAVATTLTQANHTHSQGSSSLHHSIANQSQTHASQVLHPNQINSQSNVAQMPGHQMQFQRLKVEDALSYLDQVKFKFGNQPQVYNDFLDIMKEFKSQSIDTPGVIQRVSTLFKGHPELIVGFNTFLPPGYRIEVQSNEQVQVSIPGTNMGSGAGSGPTSLTISPGGETITTTPAVHIPHTGQVNHSGHGNSPHHSSSSIASKALNHQSPASNFQAKESSQNQHSVNQNSPAHTTHSGGAGASPGVHSPNSTPQANQPVEFNHAINYVNKIKNRFQGQPDIYKQFLEILHTYQKEQRNLKDGIHSSTKPLTEAEVYAQVAKLFQNQEDLLQEFGQFLPDANGAANALVSLQPPKSMNSEHPMSTKKPVLQNKPISSPISTPAKLVPTIKRPAPSGPSTPIKKFKMTTLKDVTLAEATKCGTLNEFAFFDKVRKALKSQEAYDNFLRLLILYNQEIISRGDLVQLIAPFLSKFPELFKWLKDFLGYKECTNSIEPLPNKVATQERERVVGEFATEIDYSSCKRYGASYRAVPRNYVQPKCSGRNSLCKEVLNDTWVSFPSWSEDSTFVSSRKTQFEEHIYRCEDERFELDVVLDSNRSTIHTLETVQNKINRMSAEEKAKFRLDDTLGGSSTVIHQRAIRRVYGDKTNDIIEGLKKSPVISVPLILRRLKMKEDEWRRAQKGFNKNWKDTNEKYYLKSLDHQGITFKQNDVKCLRSKNLLSEIENVYEERHEQAEDGGEVASGPHIVITYKNKEIFKDAANLIIHHVKRQTGIHKEDKGKIKQLIRQFVPDLFSVPRGELSDDEMDKEDDMEVDDENDDLKANSYQDITSLKLGHTTNNNESASFSCAASNNSQEAHSDKGSMGKQSPIHTQSTLMENSIPGDSYALFFINNNWYVFFRLHHILCERLFKIYERAQILIADEIQDRKERKKSTANALMLKPKVDSPVESYYASFLELIKNLLDGNIEGNQYEDMLREMFGIDAYVAFTLDKAIQNIVRQLQHIVGDDVCIQSTAVFLEEQKNKAAGGLCTTASQRAVGEASYQKRVERILSDETCYRLILYKNEGKISIELLDTDSDHSEDHGENDKWSDYFGKYGVDSLSSELKEQLTKKPVFLPRNVRSRRQQKRTAEKRCGGKPGDDESPALSLNYLQDADFDNKIDLSNLEDSTAGDAVKGLVGLNAKSFLMEKTRHNSSEEQDLNRSECKFNVNSYKRLFVVHSESYLYTQMALRRAHQFHRQVSQKLNKHFHSWHNKWLADNVSEDQANKCQNWLLGLTEDNKLTSCVKVDNPLKPPYACFNRYRVEDNL